MNGQDRQASQAHPHRANPRTSAGAGAFRIACAQCGANLPVDTSNPNAWSAIADARSAHACPREGVNERSLFRAAPHEPHTNFVMGEITAWRVWRYRGGLLRSAYTDRLWMPGRPMEGDIDAAAHNQYKAAGVFAFKTEADALHEALIADGLTGHCRIVGRVTIWGEGMEHENGYRVQFAKVLSLDHVYPRWFSHRLRALRLRYHV